MITKSCNYLERHLWVFVQKHAELADTDPKVPIRELIGDIESQSSKLLPFQCHTVEYTQWEEQELEVRLLEVE